MTRFGSDRVRKYYERHTRTFVAFGEGGSLGALHRAVAGPGVTTRAGAFRYVEDVIVALARGLPEPDRPAHVIDLGCGVGGSLCYIAAQLPATAGTGITLSPTQAALARERAAASGLAGRVTFLTGDFTNVPADVAPARIVFAIESFVHAPDSAEFFGQCRRLVEPGGLLIICDDFRRSPTGAEAAVALERFCRGWHINTLLDRHALRALATAAGFAHESTTDLTPYLHLGRPRDRLIDLLAGSMERLPWRWPRLDPWLGGSALQACLRNGWLGYDLVVFRRTLDE